MKHFIATLLIGAWSILGCSASTSTPTDTADSETNTGSENDTNADTFVDSSTSVDTDANTHSDTNSDTSHDSNDDDSDVIESFYIDHFKQMPNPPECTVSPTEPAATRITVDLSMSDDVKIFPMTTNGLSIPEGHLTNGGTGVIIDGYELITYLPTGEPVEEATYTEYNNFIEYGGSAILLLSVLSHNASEYLRTAYGCDAYTYETKRSLQQNLVNAIENDISFNSDTSAVPPAPFSETITSQIVVHGHTNSGQEVTTPPFIVDIELFCGPADWFSSCFAAPCASLCAEALTQSCQAGVFPQPPCEAYLADESLCAFHCE